MKSNSNPPDSLMKAQSEPQDVLRGIDISLMEMHGRQISGSPWKGLPGKIWSGFSISGSSDPDSQLLRLIGVIIPNPERSP